jgi:hypothetical protein
MQQNIPLPKPKKIRAQFGRKRSHNEQIIVCPCGIILARETFFGAEGVASVVVSSTPTRNVPPVHSS